ncbi:MAG: nucleotidyltransferase domain-containing protein [Acidobacteriota bacterium]|nr:nucleotidyltransferase domain-containing protein [Acidobacteriota bacterium]
MEQKLTELVERLRQAHQDRLLSVILYGSAASGDHHGKYSDLNVFCVLKQVTPRELADGEPVFKWWRDEGNPAPLLMSETEVRTSTDCFPIEFHDMQERRKVLYGQDPVAELEIDRSFYRAQVEHELRAKLLRLRQQAGGLLSDSQALLRLMLDSVSTFCVLSRHALLLAGIKAGWQKRQIVDSLSKIGVDAASFRTLLDVREERRKTAGIEPAALFEEYLKQIEAVVAYVDRLQK